MKISKSKLIQMIKEEMMNEDDVDIPIGELEPQSTGMTLKSDVDLEALKQVLLDARDAYDPGEPDSVYSVVRGVERALELLGPEEETIEIGDEEPVVDLRGRLTQDPMGRGAQTSRLRRSVMGREDQ